MPRAVVTGGAGVIGSHMVDLLADHDYSVVVIDNLVTGRAEHLVHHRHEPRVAFHEMDMCTVAVDSRLFKDVDSVFHFGGSGDIVPSIEHPLECMRANVDGPRAILEASRHAGVRKFVYAESSSCSGVATELTTEEAPIRMFNVAQKLNGKRFTVVGDGSRRGDFVFVTGGARGYPMVSESAEANQIFTTRTWFQHVAR